MAINIPARWRPMYYLYASNLINRLIEEIGDAEAQLLVLQRKPTWRCRRYTR
jgi:hypothetical protein